MNEDDLDTDKISAELKYYTIIRLKYICIKEINKIK